MNLIYKMNMRLAILMLIVLASNLSQLPLDSQGEIEYHKMDFEELEAVSTPSNAYWHGTVPEQQSLETDACLASASNATLSEGGKVESFFAVSIPEEIPPWYEDINHYFMFVDRYGMKRWRAFLIYEGEELGDWYACDAYGVVEVGAKPIQTLEEERLLAPYIFEHREPSHSDWEKLFAQEKLDASLEREVIDSSLGLNYDGSLFDIWWLSKDLTDRNLAVSYWLFGLVANAEENQKNDWYRCDDMGNVMYAQKKMASSRASGMAQLEKNAVRIYGTCKDSDWSGANDWKSGIRFYAGFERYAGEYNTGDSFKRYAKFDQWIDERNKPLLVNPNIPNQAHRGETLCSGYTMRAWRTGSHGSYTYYCEVYLYDPHPELRYMTIVLDLDDDSGRAVIQNWDAKSLVEQAHTHRAQDETAPTCTSSGNKGGICILCNQNFNQIIPSLGHVVPTTFVQSGGYKIKDCGRCNARLETIANQYTLTLHSVGGNVATITKTVTYAAPYGELPPPTKVGYQFLGWFHTPEGGKQYDKNSIYLTVGNQTLFALWNPKKYDVVWQLYGPSLANGEHLSILELMEEESEERLVDITDLQRKESHQYDMEYLVPTVEKLMRYNQLENHQIKQFQNVYTFEHFVKGNQTYEGGASVKNLTTGEQARIGARPIRTKWQDLYINCIFLPEEENDDSKQNRQIVLRDYDSTAFSGNKDLEEADGVTLTVALGWHLKEFEFKPKANDFSHGIRRYYANYERNLYMVHFDGNGGNGTEREIPYGLALLELPESRRVGYTFLGWYNKKVGGEKITTSHTVPLGGATFYAQWSTNCYRLNFEAGKGNVYPREKKVTYEERYGILPIPEREDYHSTGWFVATASNAIRRNADDICEIARDQTVYAKWVLVYRDNGNGTNSRPGKDRQFDTFDDNHYYNGTDCLAGTEDDCKLYAGNDKRYKTFDDYYKNNRAVEIHIGMDDVFDTVDDFIDNENGTNRRTGNDHIFGTMDDELWSNAADGIAGNQDDYLIKEGKEPDFNQGGSESGEKDIIYSPDIPLPLPPLPHIPEFPFLSGSKPETGTIKLVIEKPKVVPPLPQVAKPIDTELVEDVVLERTKKTMLRPVFTQAEEGEEIEKIEKNEAIVEQDSIWNRVRTFLKSSHISIRISLVFLLFLLLFLCFFRKKEKKEKK